MKKNFVFTTLIIALAIMFTAACSDKGITTNANLPENGDELQGMEFFNDLLAGNITSIEFITMQPQDPAGIIKTRPGMFWTFNLDDKLTSEHGTPIYAVVGKYTYDLYGDDGSPRAYFRFIFEKNPNEGVYIRTQTYPVDNYGRKILDAPLNDYDWSSKKELTIKNGDIYIWESEGYLTSVYTKASENEYRIKDTVLKNTNAYGGVMMPDELWFAIGYCGSRIIKDIKFTKKMK